MNKTPASMDWTEPARTCRFCKKMKESGEKFVKYGPRHHAHHECFLKVKGATGLRSLPSWMVGQFPYYLLKKYNLLVEAKMISAAGQPAAAGAR